MLYKAVSNKQVTERANIRHCHLEFSLIYHRTQFCNPPHTQINTNFLREMTLFGSLLHPLAAGVAHSRCSINISRMKNCLEVIPDTPMRCGGSFLKTKPPVLNIPTKQHKVGPKRMSGRVSF